MFEGVLYNKIYLTFSEWRALVYNQIDGVTSECRIMHCLTRVPNFVEHGKKVHSGEFHDSKLLDEARANYQAFKTGLQELQG